MHKLLCGVQPNFQSLYVNCGIIKFVTFRDPVWQLTFHGCLTHYNIVPCKSYVLVMVS